MKQTTEKEKKREREREKELTKQSRRKYVISILAIPFESFIRFEKLRSNPQSSAVSSRLEQTIGKDLFSAFPIYHLVCNVTCGLRFCSLSPLLTTEKKTIIDQPQSGFAGVTRPTGISLVVTKISPLHRVCPFLPLHQLQRKCKKKTKKAQKKRAEIFPFYAVNSLSLMLHVSNNYVCTFSEKNKRVSQLLPFLSLRSSPLSLSLSLSLLFIPATIV